MSRFLAFFEQLYGKKYKRPIFVHFYLFKKTLSTTEKKILQNKFSFYKKLKSKEKRQFEHRVATFINSNEFVGRENLVVTTEMKVLIAATSVMLSFGFRNYRIDLINKIIIYPSTFYSQSNQEYHKGELNPQLNALVLSWEHFLEGYDIENDNLNLGVHEFTHAIHLNSLKNRHISSMLFIEAYGELTDLLSEEKELRAKLIASKYFRAYAFTNQFEFLAVIVETFIETPKGFREQFPGIYKKTKEMLNFNSGSY